MKESILTIDKAFARHRIAIGFILLVAFASYLPVTQGNYLYHDDYYFLATAENCVDHPQYLYYMVDIFRPLGIYIKCIYSDFFSEPKGANLARGFTIAFIGLSGILLYLILNWSGVPILIACLISAVVITMPPFQTAAAMIANATHVYGFIFGLASGWVSLQASARFLDGRRDYFKFIKLNPRVGFFLGFVLFLISALIYQPSAFAFFIPLILHVFFFVAPYKERVISALGAVVPLLIGGVTYFGTQKYVKSTYGHIFVNPTSRGELGGEIVDKIQWIAHDLLPMTLSFWNIGETWSLTAYSALTLIGVTSCVYLIGIDVDKSVMVGSYKGIIERGIILLGVFALTIASVGPFLLLKDQTLHYRVLIAFQPAIVVMMFSLVVVTANWYHGQSADFDVRPIFRSFYYAFVGLLLCIVGVGVFKAHQNVLWGYVVPQTNELTWIRNVLSSMPLKRGDHVHFVRAPNSYSLAGRPLFSDEFGSMTTKFPQDIPFITRGALRQVRGLENKNLVITSGIKPDKYDFPSRNNIQQVPDDAHIVDMSRTNLKDTFSSYIEYKVHITASGHVTASGHGRGHGIERAFDNSNAPDDFWEVAGYPQWVQVDLGSDQQKYVVGYEFQAGKDVRRMPTQWTLKGSDDGVLWDELDVKENESLWDSKQKKVFGIAASKYRYYRFDFLSGLDSSVLRLYEIRFIYSL